ncbi:MAG: RloB domain-containing protein [Chloroflexaceae bacterium]|nr:RloB domain-containing protein [Chloroflexaceae bacterium]
MSRKSLSLKRSNRPNPNSRDQRKRFLIVCEGETEKTYFNQFRVSKKIVSVGGGSPLDVVRKAHQILQQEGQDAYSAVWCVFDRDETPPTAEQFGAALNKAQESGFAVAYSNPCFEVWYLFHFVACHAHGWLTCSDCHKQLESHIGQPYAKNSRTIEQVSTICERHQATAIQHAAQLIEQYAHHDPSTDNPCTTVHKLVVAILHALPRATR